MSCSVVESFNGSEVPPVSILRVEENAGSRFRPKNWYLSRKLHDLASQGKVILMFIVNTAGTLAGLKPSTKTSSDVKQMRSEKKTSTTGFRVHCCFASPTPGLKTKI
jgi:hypothetical protein